jgi:hypothetical protein
MQAGTDLRRPRADSLRQQYGQQGEGAVASWVAGVAEVAVEKDADFLTGLELFLSRCERAASVLVALVEDEESVTEDVGTLTLLQSVMEDCLVQDVGQERTTAPHFGQHFEVGKVWGSFDASSSSCMTLWKVSEAPAMLTEGEEEERVWPGRGLLRRMLDQS